MKRLYQELYEYLHENEDYMEKLRKAFIEDNKKLNLQDTNFSEEWTKLKKKHREWIEYLVKAHKLEIKLES